LPLVRIFLNHWGLEPDARSFQASCHPNSDREPTSCRHARFFYRMRLIQTETLQLVEFMGDYDDRYAILSHTWEKEEVSLQEMLLVNKNAQPEADQIKQKDGYQKITKFAALAADDGFQYAWVDTCCIDKSSSAGLSEAINSMFRWYRKAAQCYVYLADVPSLSNVHRLGSAKGTNWYLSATNVRSTKEPRVGPIFRQSRWFTRGWTLQELLAPTALRFYFSDWTPGHTKTELSRALNKITGIPDQVLWTGDFSRTPVAEKMKWASRRQTTRIEDTAYCLLGLFDVNMPLLYGEGDKAFLRLQEEICRSTDDQSIFAWMAKSTWFDNFAKYRGLFARSPAEFIVEELSFSHSEYEGFVSPSSSTSLGFNAYMSLTPLAHVTAMGISLNPPVESPDYTNEFIAILRTEAKIQIGGTGLGKQAQTVAILIKELSPGAADRQYARVNPSILYRFTPGQSPLPPPSDLYVRNTIHVPTNHISSRWRGFIINNDSRHDRRCTIWTPYSNEKKTTAYVESTEVYCPSSISDSRHILGKSGVAAVVTLHPRTSSNSADSYDTAILGRRLSDGHPTLHILQERQIPDPSAFDFNGLRGLSEMGPWDARLPKRIRYYDFEESYSTYFNLRWEAKVQQDMLMCSFDMDVKYGIWGMT